MMQSQANCFTDEAWFYRRNVKESSSSGECGDGRERGEKVWSLAFADDLVIVAKSEKEMKEMRSLGK
jgi:hypothetical protein